MSLLDRVNFCNNFNRDNVYSFYVAGKQIGWLRKDNAEMLLTFVDYFVLSDNKVLLSDELNSFESRTKAIKEVIKKLREQKLISDWRSEMYGVAVNFGDEPYFALERSCANFFGIKSYGTHLNGYTNTDDGMKIWIAKRGDHLAYHPSLLDNLAAGGLPMGLSPRENMEKEAEEEVNLGLDMVANMEDVGVISYLKEHSYGIRLDTIFLFDLELPSDFEPIPDGDEVSEIKLYSPEEVYLLVRDTEKFKFNTNLVMIDFLLRHGFIKKDEPDYDSIVNGLRTKFF